jgi:hypothetical protein
MRKRIGLLRWGQIIMASFSLLAFVSLLPAPAQAVQIQCICNDGSNHNLEWTQPLNGVNDQNAALAACIADCPKQPAPSAATRPAAAGTAGATKDCATPKTGGGLLTDVSPACVGCGQCQIVDVLVVANKIILMLLGITGSITLLMVIVGGGFWLFSGGNPGYVEKGTKILKGSLIGLIIVFGAYTIVEFILAAVGVPDAAKIFKSVLGK